MGNWERNHPACPERRVYGNHLDLSRETMQCYAPLAERLGIWELKALFEDLAFRHQHPDDHARVAVQLESRRLWMDLFLHKILPTLELALEQAGLDARVQGRIGHVYSTFEKMQRKGRPFPDIHDLMGARVIVETPRQCYDALGVVHRLWKHIAAEFDDYIAHPKPNGYQSLHTTLISPWGFPCEVQVRTEAMHQVAEYGVCAHWRHKGSGDAGDQALNNLLCGVQRQLESIRRARHLEEHVKAWKRIANLKVV